MFGLVVGQDRNGPVNERGQGAQLCQLPGANWLLPIAQRAFDALPNLFASKLSITELTQEAIVVGVYVPHMRHDR